MKNLTILSMCLIAVMNLFGSCDSKQSDAQYLKDDNQRREALVTIVHHQPYMNEMMKQMMNSDSCKQMMAQSMMSDPKMKTMMMGNMMDMCKNDATICKMMMDKTMEMCEADGAKYTMMMDSMKPHPNVMKSMKGMCDMNIMPKK